MGMIIGFLLGGEALAFCIVALVVVRWGKKLDRHLITAHPKFLKENLSAPFWAGDSGVVRQHIRAIRNAYWGTMPDETSSFYRSKMRRYAAAGIAVLLAFYATIVIAAIVSFSFRPI